MTLNCKAHQLIADNSTSWGTDPEIFVYIGSYSGRSVCLTEGTRVINSYPEAIPFIIEYDLGVSSGPSGLFRVTNPGQLYEIFTKAISQTDGSFQIDVGPASGICSFVEANQVSAVYGVLTLEKINKFDIPASPLPYEDDRYERCSFDKKSWAQCLLRSVPGRILVELPEPMNRCMFSQVLCAVAKGGSSPIQSYVGDTFRTKDDPMPAIPTPIGAKPVAPTTVTVPSVAPAAVTPPRPPMPNAALSAAAVRAKKIKPDLMSSPVPGPAPAPVPTPVEQPPIQEESPVEEAAVEAPVVVESAPEAIITVHAKEGTSPTEPVQEQPAEQAGEVVDAEEDANGKTKRTRRSSESLDAEAAERLTARKWLVLPPVDDLGDRLKTDMAATINAITSQLDAAEDGIRALRNAMFFELNTLCKQPTTPPINLEDVAKKAVEAALAAIKQG